MRRHIEHIVAFFLVTCFAVPAAAQQIELPRARQNYYLSVGGGGMALQVWEETDDSVGVLSGQAFSIRAGQMLNRCLGWQRLSVAPHLTLLYTTPMEGCTREQCISAMGPTL